MAERVASFDDIVLEGLREAVLRERGQAALARSARWANCRRLRCMDFVDSGLHSLCLL